MNVDPRILCWRHPDSQVQVQPCGKPPPRLLQQILAETSQKDPSCAMRSPCWDLGMRAQVGAHALCLIQGQLINLMAA